MASYRCEATTHKCDSFALMKLPAELRQTIYGYYFADINEAQWFLCSAPTPYTPRLARLLPETKTGIKALKEHLPLLHANREVRAEAGRILCNQYLADAEFLFNIDDHNGADIFRYIQVFCTSFAAFVFKPEALKFGLQILTDASNESLLLDLADHVHRYAAWKLQRKAVLQYRLDYIDGSVDNDKLPKLGLNASENAFLTHNVAKMPSFAEQPELELKSAKCRVCRTIPGFEMQYDKRSFRMFGPLATIDWEYFNFENVPWHLPWTSDYDDFVNEVQSNGGATSYDSDGEPEEDSFYDTLERESDDDDDRTDDMDGTCDEYGNSDASVTGDEVDYEGDYYDHAAIG